MPRVRFSFLVCIFVAAIGCQQEPSHQPPKAPQLAASKLTILVVDDPPLAAGLKLLRGEWSERSGGQLEVQEWSTDQLLSATKLPTDLVLYPSRYVGTLVDRNWLRPVRKSVLQNPDLALDDILPLIRNVTLRYGNQVYAFSLGEPPLMIADNSSSPNSLVKFPHALQLLTRGIAYARHRSGTTGWFDAQSMQPQIATPPFVKALEEMLSQPSVTIAWPTIASPDPTKPIVFKPLPQADQVYNPVRKTWEPNDSTQPLTFLGFAGRSASVTRATRNSASAFKFLTWMISENIATQLSPRSEATLWFRKSQTQKAKKWLPRSSTDAQTTATLNRLLASDSYYLLPRIPGVDEYLQAMDKTIAQALSRKTTEQISAKKALAKIATQWNTLTDRYDRNRQRTAYRKHLGLDQ